MGVSGRIDQDLLQGDVEHALERVASSSTSTVWSRQIVTSCPETFWKPWSGADRVLVVVEHRDVHSSPLA